MKICREMNSYLLIIFSDFKLRIRPARFRVGMCAGNLVGLCIALASTLTINAQGVTFDPHTWTPPYDLPLPDNWSVERFTLPASFAPIIPYQGVEDIRFTPSWAKADSPEYWSYAFLWYLDGKYKIDLTSIEHHLQAYYTGLIDVNGSNIAREKLIPVVTSFWTAEKVKGDDQAWTGTVFMLDYMQQKPITLNGKVHVRTYPGVKNTFVFFKLSPQPFSHQVWQSLDELWSNFRLFQ